MKVQSWLGIMGALVMAGVLLGAVLLVLAPRPTSAASNTVVIAEFRTRGLAGLSDEFVELYNKSNAAVDLGQWRVNRSSSSGVVSIVSIIPTSTILAPGQHLLLINSSYSGTVTGDFTYTAGIADNGGIGLLNQAGQLVDAVGMSSGSAYLELNPLAPMTATLNQSYERKPGAPGLAQQDTDDNSADFRQNYGISHPENRASAMNPTAVTLLSFAAEAHAEGILLTWVAVDESTLYGYNLYRSSGLDSLQEQINEALIPVVAPGSQIGSTYSWLDTEAPAAGDVYYWLEEIDLSGGRRLLGSAPAPANAPPLLYLPWVAR